MGAYQMNPLAFDFFAKFSRLEYSLKATSKYRRGSDASPEADWNKFAGTKAVRALFKAVKSDKTMNVMVFKAPKKRIVRHGQLDWSDPPKEQKNMVEVRGMLRRARNNLFHGDKGTAGAERSVDILNAGIRILDCLLAADPDVADKYNEPG
jgi:hypothetical protein